MRWGSEGITELRRQQVSVMWMTLEEWFSTCGIWHISWVRLNFITLSVLPLVCSCASRFRKLGLIIVYTSWVSNRRQLLGYEIFMIWSSPSLTRARAFLCVAWRYFVRWKAIFFLLYIDDAIFVPRELRFRGLSIRREGGGMRGAIRKIPQKWKSLNVACSVLTRISLLCVRLCRQRMRVEVCTAWQTVSDMRKAWSRGRRNGGKRRITRSSVKNYRLLSFDTTRTAQKTKN